MSLTGKLILVTGGASGMGRAVCRLASEEGAKVIIADMNVNGAQETLALMTGSTSDHLVAEVNTADSSSVDRLADRILKTYDEVPSGVVHCAGIIDPGRGISACTEELWDKLMGVNLKGTYLISRKFSLMMKEKGVKGSIVNFSSVAAYGRGTNVAYAASKAGVIGFTLTLAHEMAACGIRVNAVVPGLIDTPLAGITPDKQDKYNQMIPLKRAGAPEEVGHTCVFLISDKSSYVTAAVHNVHGGWY